MGFIAAAFGIGAACSISLANVAWIGAGAIWIAAAAVKKQVPRWTTTGLERPLGLFALWSLIASNWSAGAGEIWHNYKSETLILVFFVMTQVFDEENNRRFLRAFLIGSLVNAAWGCLQAFLGLSWDPTTYQRSFPPFLSFLGTSPFMVFRYLSLRDGRAVGLRSHPLTYAECLLIPFFLYLTSALESEPGRLRWRPLAAAALSGLAILFSQSRGVWVGLAMGLLFLALFRQNRRTWIAAGGIILLAVAAIWIAPEARLRLVSIYQTTSGQDESSKDVRYELWAASWEMFKTNPFLGVGTGNVRIYRPQGESSGTGPKTWTESHNIFLQEAAEKGVVGLALFIWLLWGLGKAFYRAAVPWRDGLVAGFSSLLVCGLTESWAHDSTVLIVLFSLSGFACRLKAPE